MKGRQKPAPPEAKIPIMGMPRFSVSRPVTIVMLYVGLLTLALVGFSRMRLDMLPDISFPTIAVVTPYRGAGAEEVESKVTRPIESGLSIVQGLKDVQSTSKEGLSMIQVRFDWGVPVNEAANDVRDKLGNLSNILPEGADSPYLLRFDLKDIPILFISARAKESYPQLFHILNNQVADAFKRVPGVGNIFVRGGWIRQININVDRQRLESVGLALGDIRRALLANNLTQPAGNIKMGDTSFLLRVPGEFESVDEISGIAVGSSGGRQVYLRDVAKVADDYAEETEKIVVNGSRAALLFIQKRSGANTIEVADAAKKMIPEIQKRLPPDVQLEVINDSSKDIKAVLSNLTEAMWVALLLVIIVVFLFLRELRPALVVCLSIPISLLDAFFFQYLLGYSINMISMMAMTIAVGLVVDDAIVVMENQIRHQRELKKSAAQAAVEATSEVGRAVISATLTSVVIFVPLIFAKGIGGIFFGQLAVVISVTLIISLFDSLTLNPMLCSLLLHEEGAGKSRHPFLQKWYDRTETILVGLETTYQNVIRWALGHKKTVGGAAAVIFLGTMALAPLVGTDFFPEQDSGDIQINVELPVGTKVEATHVVMERIAKEAQEVIKPEELVRYFWRDGVNVKNAFGGLTGQKEDSYVGQFNIKLVAKENRSRSAHAVIAVLRERLRRLPGVTRLDFASGDFTSRLLTGGTKPLVVEIYGYDLNETARLAEQVKEAIQKVPGVVDPAVSLDLRRPEYHVIINREKAAALGVPVQAVAETVNLGFAQQRASVYRELGDEFDMVIRMRDQDRRATPDLEGLFVKGGQGQLIRLANLVEFKRVGGPVQIDRANQQRVVRIGANLAGKSLGEVTAGVRKAVAKIPLPPGVSIDLVGAVKEQQESFQSLALALVLGMMLTYMVMAAQFESFLTPFIIMFAVPFGFVGIIWAFLLAGYTLNLASFLGIIMMVGLVVKNAIVYLDYVLQMEHKGLSVREALIEAGRVRLRPILMTALAMVFGLLPMAVSNHQGSETWQPMALSVIGGLLVSTTVTLVLIPTLYGFFGERRERRRAATHSPAQPL